MRMRELDSHKPGAGKGDLPRNCWSDEFRKNFDAIFGDKNKGANGARKFRRTKKVYK